MQRLKIRYITDDESFNPSFGGQYKNKQGQTCLLTHPQASTLRVMDKLKTSEDQFEFYCYAYLRELLDLWLMKPEAKAALGVFDKLHKKYGMPWRGNVKNTLPAIESWTDHRIITKDRIDIQKIKEEFDKYFEYEFVLY